MAGETSSIEDPVQRIPRNRQDMGVANAKVPTLTHRSGQLDLQLLEEDVDQLQRPSDLQRLTGLGVIYQVVRIVLQSDGFAHLECRVRTKFFRQLDQFR